MTRLLMVPVIVLAFGMAWHPARAESFPTDQVYGGAGIVVNSISQYDDATGAQIFVGMNMPIVWGDAIHSVETGYMDSGDFDLRGPPPGPSRTVRGLWGSYNLKWSLNKDIAFFVRAGIDLGDDDGVLLGGGAELDFNAPVKVRLEFVERQETRSLQANLVYYLQ